MSTATLPSNKKTNPKRWDPNVWLVASPSVLRELKRAGSREGKLVALFVESSREDPNEEPIIYENVTKICKTKRDADKYMQEHRDAFLLKEGKRCKILIDTDNTKPKGRAVQLRRLEPDFSVRF